MPIFSSEATPLLASRFAVAVALGPGGGPPGRMVMGTFTECSGLGASVEVETYHEGGHNQGLRKFPGKTDYGNLVLKRVTLQGTSLLDWLLSSTGPNMTRQNISVMLYAGTDQELARWNFKNAFPVKWTGPTLQGNSNAVAIESIEFAHEGPLPTTATAPRGAN